MRVGEQDANYLMGPSGNAEVSPISRPRILQTLSSRVACLLSTNAMSNKSGRSHCFSYTRLRSNHGLFGFDKNMR
jgi:hypothetical protein